VPNQRRDPGRPGRPARVGRSVPAGRATEARRARRPAEPVRPAERPIPRPTGTRRPGAGATRTRAPQPDRFTGRAATLTLVLVALLLAYAYPMRIYLSQQEQIAALEDSQRAQLARIQAKQTEVQKWNDTDYIIAMAHRRLQLVLPGDRAIVTGPAPGTAGAAGDPQAGQAADTGPWYGKLWSSVQAADKPGSRP